MTRGTDQVPQGFVLSDAAMYSFLDQDVFPDILSFCSAIPDHLKPLFLIPVSLQAVTASRLALAAVRVASSSTADGAIPSGSTEDADLFGTKTFVYDDVEPTVPSSEPGSIFEPNDADDLTRHQDLEENQDQNFQVPTDTSYMSDVDVTESGFQYPYRTEESPVRHSTVLVVRRRSRVALKPEDLESRTPEKIRDNAQSCSVKLVSYDKRGRVYTFSVVCGNKPRTVRASMTDVQHVALSCDCPFWRWNGPEFHAQANSYMLGSPEGSAAPPDVRDPDRTYWLCKHAYSVLARMDDFVSDVIDQNWEDDEEPDDEDVLEAVDQNWSELEDVVQIPLDEAEEDDVELDWVDSESEDATNVSEDFEEAPDEYGGEEEPEPEYEEPESDEPEPEPEPESDEPGEEPDEEPEPDIEEPEPEPEPEEPEPEEPDTVLEEEPEDPGSWSGR